MESAAYNTPSEGLRFRDTYQQLLQGSSADAATVRETADRPTVSERALQVLWQEQSFPAEALRTQEGHRVQVVSPGWWNHSAGPDFRGAQLTFNGELFNGDVEVHLTPEGWRAHGHHLDARYDKVILHVVLDAGTGTAAVTSAGRTIPMLALRPHLSPGWMPPLEDESDAAGAAVHGACSALIPQQGIDPLVKALELAAEWRMLTKARTLRERMDRAGADQALYEMVAYAAGFSNFKHHFQAIARQLPYDRAAQLAQLDPMLLEAALLHIAGLLPEALPVECGVVPHHVRLRTLLRERLQGLGSMPLVWKRVALRPANHPERRLAGLARVVARSARPGLAQAVLEIWRIPHGNKERTAAFEALFPSAMGFWGTHYTWAGKQQDAASAPLGKSRVLAIIGNVFVPFGLAAARQQNNRTLEEQVLKYFCWLPKESNNHVLARMEPRLLGDSGARVKWRFQLQQGALQLHQDWCGPNPSCQNCSMYRYLDKTGQ